ncbi:unnamed protein product, partial [Effrenium voratum]
MSLAPQRLQPATAKASLDRRAEKRLRPWALCCCPSDCSNASSTNPSTSVMRCRAPQMIRALASKSSNGWSKPCPPTSTPFR